MKSRNYCLVSGLIFMLVALAHLARLIYGWQIQLADILLPMWVSWVGLVIPALLALWAFSVIPGNK